DRPGVISHRAGVGADTRPAAPITQRRGALHASATIPPDLLLAHHCLLERRSREPVWPPVNSRTRATALPAVPTAGKPGPWSTNGRRPSRRGFRLGLRSRRTASSALSS